MRFLPSTVVDVRLTVVMSASSGRLPHATVTTFAERPWRNPPPLP